MKCDMCGEEATDGNMCNDCRKGFDNKKMINCKICGKLTNSENGICTPCLSEYQPKIKAFLEDNPGLTYMEAVCHKELPIPRNAFYELSNAGIITIK
jgi:hypothetical protein